MADAKAEWLVLGSVVAKIWLVVVSDSETVSSQVCHRAIYSYYMLSCHCGQFTSGAYVVLAAAKRASSSFSLAIILAVHPATPSECKIALSLLAIPVSERQ